VPHYICCTACVCSCPSDMEDYSCGLDHAVHGLLYLTSLCGRKGEEGRGGRRKATCQTLLSLSLSSASMHFSPPLPPLLSSGGCLTHLSAPVSCLGSSNREASAFSLPLLSLSGKWASLPLCSGGRESCLLFCLSLSFALASQLS